MIEVALTVYGICLIYLLSRPVRPRVTRIQGKKRQEIQYINKKKKKSLTKS